jgi:hypothetical protein
MAQRMTIYRMNTPAIISPGRCRPATTAHRLARDHRVQHQHHRRRDQDAQEDPAWITPVTMRLS